MNLQKTVLLFVLLLSSVICIASSDKQWIDVIEFNKIKVSPEITDVEMAVLAAAKKGDVGSLLVVAGALFEGVKFEKNYIVAKQIYVAILMFPKKNVQIAVRKEAWYKLGLMAEKGLGFSFVDYTSAAKFYSEAAKLGHLESITKLAEFFKEGKGVEKDLGMSIMLTEKAIKIVKQRIESESKK